ncbi:MAG: histidine phosphatase family protein, partial [Acidimicrobiales bacterium]
RGLWKGNDLDRPLTARGHEQATAIADALADRPIGCLLSSRARRCTQTLGPLAARLALPMEVRDQLTEGADVAELVDLLRALAGNDSDAVLCSHGDLIPAAVSRLMGDGMSVTGPQGCAKGSIWQLGLDGSGLLAGSYVADPALNRYPTAS